MNNILDMVVIEYSLSQTAYHVSSMFEMLSRNLQNAQRGRHTDFLPVAVCYDEDMAKKLINELIEGNGYGPDD